VTLPLAAPGVVAGLALAYATSLGEFGAVITFAASIPGQTQTLPLAIFAALQVPGGEAQAARLAVASLVLAVLGLGAAELLGRRVNVWVGR
jgi:molybdate transport system permease protein